MSEKTVNAKAALETYANEINGWMASQLDACTRCGLCAEACHFYVSTGNPNYTPIWKAELLRRVYQQKFTPAGRLASALGLVRPITEENLREWVEYDYFACTMCNRCSQVCPMGIDIASLIHVAREGLAAAGLVPEDLMQATNRQVEEGSPLGVTDDVFEERLELFEDFLEDADYEGDIPIDKQGADSLVVFSSIEIMKFPHNFVAIAKILDAAGENWTISKQAREVVNFGFYAAEGKLTKQFMDRVVEGAKALGVKRLIVTECGHAYDALRFHAANIYGEQLPFEVTRITAVIGELLQAGRIKLKKGAFDNGKTITFHDACKIQRRGGMMKEPRMVMKQIAPESFKEMVPNNEDAWCCGGGGGVISIDAATPVRMAAFGIKVDQMRDVKADTVVMSCSNCRLQFLDGVKHFNLDVEVTGLAQMVADALEG